MNLSGKTICITGANGILGRAVARAASEAGANLVLLDVVFENDNVLGLDGAQQQAVDLTDQQATKALLDKVGRVDGLANIAGGFSMGKPTHELTDDEWNQMFNINVKTAHNAVRAVVPGMLAAGGGSIVNTGAIGGLQGGAYMSAYSASKSTVMRITESLAGELKDEGINVNAVLPSVIDTPRNRAAMPDADPSRWVTPEDLAAVIVFLLSDASKAINGALIPVAGLS